MYYDALCGFLVGAERGLIHIQGQMDVVVVVTQFYYLGGGSEETRKQAR